MVHDLIQWAMFLGVYGGILVGLRVLPALARAIGRWRARRRVAGNWSLALVVYLDEQTGLVHPSVQIFGRRLPSRSKLRLEVVDPLGVTRHTTTKSVPPSAGGREIDLPGFRCSGAHSMEEPLSWRWNVTLRAGRRRLAQTGETLYEAGGINDEAEIAIG